MQKNATAIAPNKVAWKMLEDLGLSRERLEANGELDKMGLRVKYTVHPTFGVTGF